MNKHCKHLDMYQAGVSSPPPTAKPKHKRNKAGSMQNGGGHSHISEVTASVIATLKGIR